MKENLNLVKLNKKELEKTKGGQQVTWKIVCSCGCLYEGTPGGSSINANSNANYEGDLHTPRP